MTLKIPDGGFIYGPDAVDGRSLVIRSLLDQSPVEVHHDDDHLVGSVAFDLGSGDFHSGVEVEIQFCTPELCFPAQTLWCLPTHAAGSDEERTAESREMSEWITRRAEAQSDEERANVEREMDEWLVRSRSIPKRPDSQ